MGGYVTIPSKILAALPLLQPLRALSVLLIFCGGTQTTNRQPLAVSVFCPLGMLVNNFLFDQTNSSSVMYFSVSFKWIYCYN